MSVISKLNQTTFTTHSEIRFGSDLIAEVVRRRQRRQTRFSLVLWTLSTACGDDYLIIKTAMGVKRLENG
jgi:hypothetical protein